MAVITLSMLQTHPTPHDEKKEQHIIKAKAFLEKLLDEQNLSKNFPELKIDFY